MMALCKTLTGQFPDLTEAGIKCLCVENIWMDEHDELSHEGVFLILFYGRNVELRLTSFICSGFHDIVQIFKSKRWIYCPAVSRYISKQILCFLCFCLLHIQNKTSKHFHFLWKQYIDALFIGTWDTLISPLIRNALQHFTMGIRGNVRFSILFSTGINILCNYIKKIQSQFNLRVPFVFKKRTRVSFPQETPSGFHHRIQDLNYVPGESLSCLGNGLVSLQEFKAGTRWR